MQTTTLQPMPPFVTDEFVLKVLLTMGGKATLPDMKAYIKMNYSGWTENSMMYIGSQLGSLCRSGYVSIEKIDYRKRNARANYYVTSEARAIIEASR